MTNIIRATFAIAILMLGIVGTGIVINNQTQAAATCTGTVPAGDSIHFQPAVPNRSNIAEETARQIAIANSSMDVSGAQSTNAQFVLFSDDAHGTANASDDENSLVLDYQDVPAWVVTFCGVTSPTFIPFDANDPRMKSPIATTQRHEWNVVVNGSTGEVMEEYSIR